MIAVLAVHLYKLTNTLPNHDSLYNYYSDQNVLGSGRWALSAACGISSYYDLPWVNGLFCCLFIALTVVVIVALFQVKNYVVIGLIGTLLAVSPATTETFFFMFTADGYMLAMLLAAIAAYLSRIEERRLSRWIISGICICVSCGIYQAYVSFGLILAVCYLVLGLLDNRYDKKECWLWVLRQVVIYAAALVVYYIIWKLCMHITGTNANSYQGISGVGTISIGLIINGAISAVKSVVSYLLQWDVFTYGFTTYNVLNIILLTVFAFGVIISFAKSGIYKRKWAVVLLVLCLVAIVPFACIWHFTSDSVVYAPRMFQSLTLVYVFTALLYEKWAKHVLKNIVCLLLIVITLNHGLIANICYFYLNLSYERAYAEGVEMAMTIHDYQDEHDINRIAIVGNRLDDVQLSNFNEIMEADRITDEVYIIGSGLEESLMIDSTHITNFLKTTCGIKLDVVGSTESSALFRSEQVQKMGCWPASDSIAVIDDTLVIKISNHE